MRKKIVQYSITWFSLQQLDTKVARSFLGYCDGEFSSYKKEVKKILNKQLRIQERCIVAGTRINGNQFRECSHCQRGLRSVQK